MANAELKEREEEDIRWQSLVVADWILAHWDDELAPQLGQLGDTDTGRGIGIIEFRQRRMSLVAAPANSLSIMLPRRTSSLESRIRQ